MKIALSGMGSVTSQCLLRSIRSTDPSAWVLGLDADPWAVGLYQCDAQAIIPPAVYEQAYLESLLKLLKDQRIDMFIPGVDPELLPVARHKALLESPGCKVMVASPEVIEICRDKERTFRVLSEAGLPFVRTWGLGAFRDNPPDDSWPVILKPRKGSGSKGVRIAFDAGDLPPGAPAEDYIVQDYLIPASWGLPDRRALTPDRVYKNARLRQEDEVGVQGIVGPDGSIVGLSACWHEHVNGNPWKTYCFSDPAVHSTARAVLEFLVGRGLRGVCNLQGRVTSKGFELLEIGPRFTANTSMRSAVGFNEFRALVDLFLRGRPVAEVAADLVPDESKVCLRYIAEEVVPRERIERLARDGQGEGRLPPS